jgi:hypothetical protein
LRGEGSSHERRGRARVIKTCLPIVPPFFRAFLHAPKPLLAAYRCVVCTPQSPSIHAFRGDAPELLDALLCSVQNPAKPKLNPALDQRELTPYFGSAEPAFDAAAAPQRCALG